LWLARFSILAWAKGIKQTLRVPLI